MAKPNRGDTQAPPGYFLPNHSSLFPKKPSPFHMGLYFGKVPTVNPSVTAAPCQLPLAREPLGCSDEAPLAKGGCLGTAEAGGFRGQGHGTYSLFTIHYSLFTKKPSPFHMGWYFGGVPTVNPSVKNQRFLPAPFGKGAFGAGLWLFPFTHPYHLVVEVPAVNLQLTPCPSKTMACRFPGSGGVFPGPASLSGRHSCG